MRSPALLALGLLLAGCPRQPPPTTSTFSDEADALLEAAEAEGAITAALVLDGATGIALYARRPATRLLPASTMKVVTTVAALEHLGPDFRFRTPVSLEGRRSGELFEGRVIVEASGDPSLGSWRWPEISETAPCDRIAVALAESGITRWNGPLEVRGAGSVSLGPGWAWDDAPYDYSAVPDRFVFRENVLDLRLSRASCSATPKLEVMPAVPGILGDIAVEVAARGRVLCRWDGSASTARCHWNHTTERCPREASFRLSTDAAPRLFAACVETALAQAGITHDAALPVLPDSDVRWSPLTDLESPPLSELVRVTNKESLNLYAERLGLELARHLGLEGFEGLRSALLEDLQGRGVEARDVVVADGSGLSRYNLATPRALATVVYSALRAPWAEVFVDSLPIAGEDGTLARRRISPAAAGRIRAKSGSMTGQRAWVGLVDRPGDAQFPRVVFVLMIGNAHQPELGPNEVFERFADALVVEPLGR